MISPAVPGYSKWKKEELGSATPIMFWRPSAPKRTTDHTESSLRAFCSMVRTGSKSTRRHGFVTRSAPVASDLKRVRREKAKGGERTSVLTADVSEAHRQILSLASTWLPSSSRRSDLHQQGRHFRGGFSILPVVGGVRPRTTLPVTGSSATKWHQLTCRRRLQPGSRRGRMQRKEFSWPKIRWRR